MAVNQTAQQTDQFLLTYQFYNYFVCDKSRGLLVRTPIASYTAHGRKWLLPDFIICEQFLAAVAAAAACHISWEVTERISAAAGKLSHSSL